MDERRRAAWAALGLGPLWMPRQDVRVAAPSVAQPVAPQPDALRPIELQPIERQPDGPQPTRPRPDHPQPGESLGLEGEDRPGAAQPIVRLESLRAQVAGCPKCRLSRSRTQTVFGEGNPRATWMFVGEAPGAEEDARGEPFVGQSGRLLDAMLASIGLDRARDVYIANVVKCRPPGNRNPQPDEVASCEPYLREQIALVRPALLVLMGRFAAQALLRSTESVGALRGRVHRYDAGDFQVPAVVTYHPAYLLRTPADKAKAWRDLCAARAEHARLTGLAPQPVRAGG